MAEQNHFSKFYFFLNFPENTKYKTFNIQVFTVRHSLAWRVSVIFDRDLSVFEEQQSEKILLNIFFDRNMSFSCGNFIANNKSPEDLYQDERVNII